MNENNGGKKSDIRAKAGVFILGAVLYFPVLAVICLFERYVLRPYNRVVYFAGMIIAGILLSVFIYTATMKIHNDNIIKRILSVKINDVRAVLTVAVVGIMVIPLLVLFWYGIFYAKSMLIVVGSPSVFEWILNTVIFAQTSFMSCYITLSALFTGRRKSSEKILCFSAAMPVVNILSAVLMAFFGMKFYIL